MISSPVIWIASGIVLIVAEFFVPAFILIFFGAAAVITGLCILTGTPDTLAGQLGLFAVLSLALLLGLRRAAKKVFKGLTADVADTEPGFEDFVGRDATVVSFDVATGKGRVTFRGTDWAAESDVAVGPGEVVRIIARHGSVLTLGRHKDTPRL